MENGTTQPGDRPKLLADRRSSLPYDAPELAEEIVSILHAERINPVLVFGTQASGKTVMLQSLFHYLKSNDDTKISLSLGRTIWMEMHNARNVIEESGRAFLDNGITAFDDGRLPAATSRLSPFFIPVDIKRDGVTTRYAFMEGMGEWFQREGGTQAGGEQHHPFRPFQEILACVLRSFQHGISMIFVAPCIDGVQNNKKEYAHECLANAMSEVERIRIDKNRDNLLLLVNKWDAVCPPGEVAGRFSDATAADVLDRIRDWRYVWAKFVSLQGFSPTARAVMPYSAGWIQPDRRIIRSTQYAPIFARYNRTVWNWLYANAGVAFGGDVAQRRILYPDVLPKTVQPMGPFERLSRILTLNIRS
ncbi:hypothetical protein [uncultured Methylobacterium sp.]|uniref:hypothetical protein n=1 Tax=uncultured Methylobacterium sp. TaxID=157278 RepID=UPI00258AB4D9|nr:hypothetical protein [uncultured Methylobacterium sp.]